MSSSNSNSSTPGQSPEVTQLRCQSPPLIRLGKIDRKYSAVETPSPKTDLPDDTPRKLSDSVIPLKTYKSKFTLENLTSEMKKTQNLSTGNLNSPKTLYTKKPSLTPLPISPIKILDTSTPFPETHKESLPGSFQEYSYLRERKFSEKSDLTSTSSDFSDEELVKTPKKTPSRKNLNLENCSQNWKVQLRIIQEKKLQRPQQVTDEWRRIMDMEKMNLEIL